MPLMTQARPKPMTRTDSDQAQAFSALYTEHIQRVYRYHLARTGDASLAEDLAAETFRAALEAFPGYRPEKGSPAAWLLGIAHHKLVDAFRRRRVHLPLEHAENLPAGGQMPEDAAAQRLEMARVARALGRMTAERSEALALHFFAGLSLAEAGAVMGKSAEAAKKLVQRGLADLRRALADKDEVDQ